ncbi:MAG: hypothetical protein H8D78_09445 [Chloroflexi bacterium]|nr:hypothetical protein [Chloroflexota bacterium]
MKHSRALVPALLLLAAVLISVTMTAAQEPTSPIANTGDFAAETSAGAVVRAGSGVILQDGGTVTLPVDAIEVQNLMAATVMVGYDPAVLQVAGCQRNPAFDVGLCIPQCTECDRDDDGVLDAVKFAVGSMEPEGLSAAEGSPLNLADITWAVVGEPDLGVTSTLEVEVPTFTDPLAIPISVSAENGQVMVGTACVRVHHIMAVVAHWGQPASGGNEHYDLVPDGIIDVQDVMALAQNWRDAWP